MNVSLIGYMGSGKSTIGNILANQLNLSFVDLDHEIEQTEGYSIKEIFAQKGEIGFRKTENQILNNYLNQNENYVLAVGGGTAVFYNNIQLINQHSHSVYLQATPTLLAARLITQKDSRPLIKHLKTTEQLIEFIAKHLLERQHYYQQAKSTISLKEIESPQETASRIQQLILSC